MLGNAAAGLLSDRFGRKRVLLFTALLFVVSALSTSLATNFAGFVTARIVGGLAVGAAILIVPVYIAEISPRPVLLIAGENAHSRYFSEDAYAAAVEPKELMIIPGVDHVALYDRMDAIPFDGLHAFFAQHLSA